MDAARNAVSSFLSRDGQHQTAVDEVVNPAVTSETVKPHRHEEVTEAVDREVHQDHYHTTVQPIQHQEVLPEQHTHNLVPQIEKTFTHGDLEQDKQKNLQELGQFKDATTVHETSHSTAAAPAVTGEHVHHHVHETVQPVIHKETIQPEIVHTVIPVHEKHIAPSEHHGLSTLPMKTMDEFKQLGTDLTQKHHAQHEYEGHPRPYNAQFQEERKPVDIHPEQHEGTHDPEKTGHFDHLKKGADKGVTSGATSTGLDSTRDHETTSGHGNTAAMASAVAGVTAGSAAQDLGHDHTRAGETTDLNPRDTTGPVGDSGVDTAGTSLGGRTEGNTVSGATDAATGNTSSDSGLLGGRRASRHEMEPLDRGTTTEDKTQPSTVETGEKTEPTNLEGGDAKVKSSNDDVQHASQIGEDPSLVTSNEVKQGKMTGTGVDGSHSAVFGLTPDGHKFEDTKTTSDNITAAAKDESSKRDSGIGEEEPRTDGKESVSAEQGTTSEGVGTGKVAEQMNDPRVAEKGHEGQASYGESDGKPGAGVATST